MRPLDPRLRALIQDAIPRSLQKSRSLSSVASPGIRNSFDDDPEGGSAVYKHALKFQRPTVLRWGGGSSVHKHAPSFWCPTAIRLRDQSFYNSVSFVGTVVLPPKVTNTRTGRLGAHALLSVAASRQSKCSFRILLQTWRNMAEISLKHLKPNDFIYVSGILGFYERIDASGSLRTMYKVTVRELHYVADTPNCRGQPSRKSGKSESKGVYDDIGSPEEKKQYRIHLWQVFFANPYEWWDNRKNKMNPLAPDFKHKDTDEVLWLRPDDPPWIEKQLQILDRRNAAAAAAGQGAHPNARRRLSVWEYDE